MFVIGIAGSPAGGKSTVAARLQEHGATWINADLIAREVLEQPQIQSQLVAHFGPGITDHRGRIDRTKLAGRVFGADDSNRAGLNYLERLIHPQTHQIIADRLRAATACGAPAVILDVPLLFESEWDRVCDEVWCVDSDRNARLQRARSRGWNEDEIRRRESNQLSIQDKKHNSTVVIENDGSLEELHRNVDRLWQSLTDRVVIDPHDRHCV